MNSERKVMSQKREKAKRQLISYQKMQSNTLATPRRDYS